MRRPAGNYTVWLIWAVAVAWMTRHVLTWMFR